MSNTEKHVKMADIARELGVSTVAVSKALAGQKGVSEELRARVRRLADDMGYLSPAVRRKSRQGEGYNIGVLIPERYLDYNETFYWKLYQEVTARAMQKECFTLLEMLRETDAASGRFPKLVTENKVDALIIIGKPPHGYARKIRDEWPHPVVFLDFYDSDISADSVISNGFYGTYLMTRYLIDRGHRDIGFVGTLLATDSITDRYLGFVKAMLEHGLPVRPEWQINDRDPESGNTLPMTFSEKMPTAYVCNCDFMAGALIGRLKEKGLRVPEDVSVVGFDNYLFTGLCDIGITTYAVDIREMARCAVRTVQKKLSGEPYRTGMQITDGYLVERQSVRTLEK